jgi:Tfp pilus assembly protein PilZ
MTAWAGLNRRKFPRVNFPCLVIIKYDQGMEDVLLTHTENLGVGGICVILKKNVKMFAPVMLELDLLDTDEHIQCNGKVVWCVRRSSAEEKKPFFFDVGVEFVDLKEHDHKRLGVVIESLVAKGLTVHP